MSYDINPWMHGVEAVDAAAAKAEWQAIVEIYTGLGWQVRMVEPEPALPDMVFATDSCLMLEGKILLSNFRFGERRPETAAYEKWLTAHGYTNIKQAAHFFEGGDHVVCGNKILAAHGFRSSEETAGELARYFPAYEVIPLTLVDPLFYHLDTCLAGLSANTIACYFPALDAASQQRLRAAFPQCIEATREEAESFGLNAVSDGHHVVTSNASPSLLQKFEAAGFTVIGTSILEFRKSGGGVKCLTLELDR